MTFESIKNFNKLSIVCSTYVYVYVSKNLSNRMLNTVDCKMYLLWYNDCKRYVICTYDILTKTTTVWISHFEIYSKDQNLLFCCRNANKGHREHGI